MAYCSQMSAFDPVPKARSILQDYFGGNPPASTLCVLRGPANPNFLLEIEAIAAL
jgi:2-iminobutanoate/2-iminopropanoate deaminase